MKILTKLFLNPEWEFKETKTKIFVSREKVGWGWYNSKSFFLPKEIELNEKFAECAGLYLGDGKLTIRDLMHLDFTNKDLDLVKKIFLFFKNLGVRDSDITFTIDYTNGNISKIEENVSNYLGKQKFRIVKTDRNRYPTVHVQVNGKIFRLFFEKILMKSLGEIKKSSDLRKAFLKGYFAAEGWIGYQYQEKYLAHVGFAYNPKKEEWLRDFCIECLNLEGITSKIRIRQHEHGGWIIITNWENYYRLWKLGVFDGCERKKEKFLKILNEVKICCKIKDEMRLRLFSGDQYKLAKDLGTYQATVSNMKTGSKRNMWPTRLQVRKLAKLNSINLEEVKNNISHVRFGSLATLEARPYILDDIFNLKNPSS